MIQLHQPKAQVDTFYMSHKILHNPQTGENNMTASSLQNDPSDTTHTTVIVTRLIRYKLHKIEFNKDTPAHEIVPYFNMSDEEFLKYSIRLH